MSLAPPITAEQLLGIHDDQHRFELIAGRLVVMELNGALHGIVGARVATPLIRWIDDRNLGVVVAGGTGFVTTRDPDTVRAPDFAFIRQERVPEITEMYFEGVPDFVVEVISHNEIPDEVYDKARRWIAGGVGEAWVLDPPNRALTVHLPGHEPHTLGPGDKVHATGPLAGFSHPVADFFPA